ncbi:MAG: M23 family metallopeptidase [Hominilimicola sp.]
MKKTSKILLLLTFVLIFSIAPQVFAATSLPSITSSKPITCYTINSSGKIYAYTAKDLKTKTGGYISCSTDECKILQISGNAVQVKYPVSGGTKTAWFARSAFTSYDISKGAAEKWTQSSKITTYRRSDGKTSLGYISAGDVCYKLVAKGSYTQVVYPVSGGYKMGWVKTSEIKKKSTNNISSSSSAKLLYPLKGSITVTGYSATTNGYKCDYKAASGTPLYAPADGTVEFRQSYATAYGKLASYGNNIVFKSSDGNYTVKCAHLSKFNNVALTYKSSLSYPCSASKYKCNTITLKTKSVKQGDLIGYTGSTGNASGPHLHLEVYKNGTAVNPSSVFTTWK